MLVTGFSPALLFNVVGLAAMSTIRTIDTRCRANSFAVITITISVRLLVGTFVCPMPLLVAYEAHSLKQYERDLSVVIRFVLGATSHCMWCSLR
jgi:hypothetical protein